MCRKVRHDLRVYYYSNDVSFSISCHTVPYDRSEENEEVKGMYTSIFLLSHSNTDQSKKYQNRWKTKEGVPLKHHIFRTLRDGSFEQFLHRDFAKKKLPILEHDKDLKGLYIEDEVIIDHPHHALKGIDLSYTFIDDSQFKRLYLQLINFSFASLHNVTFVNCTFSYATFYACYLENVTFINCDFLERNNIRNCRFTNVKFKNCYIDNNMFHSCRFDERTDIEVCIHKSHHQKKPKYFKLIELPELSKGIKDGYKAGNVTGKAREYYFLEKQAITRYILDNPYQKAGNYFLEMIAGYGVKPLRVLLSMILVFLLFSEIFTAKLGYPAGLLLSTGGYFTNGASSDMLQKMDPFYLSLFIIESFLGIMFTALFVTVMANLWLSEKQ
jgi:hypothetical protein